MVMDVRSVYVPVIVPGTVRVRSTAIFTKEESRTR